jgi:nucleoid DNA-binding protein
VFIIARGSGKKQADVFCLASHPAPTIQIELDRLPRENFMAKATAISEPLTKSQLLTTLAEGTGLSKKECSLVLDELGNVIHRHLKKRGAGTFTMPGMFKIKTQRKPATKARKGINPFSGEETVFKAKPARTVVKVQPLKALKDMVE